jgi:hypothetical protein
MISGSTLKFVELVTLVSEVITAMILANSDILAQNQPFFCVKLNRIKHAFHKTGYKKKNLAT